MRCEKNRDFIKTSVIVATQEGGAYMRQCIGMLRERLSGESYEIIAVDNSSTDDAYRWLSLQPDIRVIRMEGACELAVAWNRGMKVSDGEALLFLHDDVLLSRNAFHKMRELLWSREDVGAVGPYTNKCHRGPQEVHISRGYCDLAGMEYIAEEVERNQEKEDPGLFLESFCLMVKRDAATKAGCFDESYRDMWYGDIDFSLRLQRIGYFLVRTNAYVHHEIKDTPVEKDASAFHRKWQFSPSYSMDVRYALLKYIETSRKDLCVLDVGCACGGNLMDLKYHNPLSDLYGIELNKGAATVAGFFGKVTPKDVEHLEKPDWHMKFDNIIMGDILEHLRDPWAVLRTMTEYLKPGGRVLVSIPNVNHISNVALLLNGSWHYREEGILDRTHLRFFTRRSFMDCLREAGLRPVSIDAVHVQLTQEWENLMGNLCAMDGVSVTGEEFLAYQWIFVAERL